MSLIFSCGFARVAVKESFHKAGRAQQETDPVQRWKNYCNMFDETARSMFTVTNNLQSIPQNVLPKQERLPKAFFPFELEGSTGTTKISAYDV